MCSLQRLVPREADISRLVKVERHVPDCLWGVIANVSSDLTARTSACFVCQKDHEIVKTFADCDVECGLLASSDATFRNLFLVGIECIRDVTRERRAVKRLVRCRKLERTLQLPVLEVSLQTACSSWCSRSSRRLWEGKSHE